MCRENRVLFFILLAALLLASAVGVLRGEEQPDRWYLTSEAELRNIEQYKASSDREKANWRLQASDLRIRAEKSEADSRLLNNQLLTARETNRKLALSYNELEQEQLTRLSLKNGEIAGLKQELAARTLEAEKYKGGDRAKLIVIIALTGAIAAYIAFKVCRFLKIIP
jgi:outer membrane PBP1 activator LpoA protein